MFLKIIFTSFLVVFLFLVIKQIYSILFPTFRCFYDNIFWGIIFIWIFYFMSKSKNIAKTLNSEINNLTLNI